MREIVIILLIFLYTIGCMDLPNNGQYTNLITLEQTLNEDIKYQNYTHCVKDSCLGCYVVNELYYIEDFFMTIKSANQLDSFFYDYNIDADTLVDKNTQIKSIEDIYYTKRKYFKSHDDSSYYIFHAYIIDNRPEYYRLFKAKITDNKFKYLDKIYIGVDKSVVTKLFNKYRDSHFKLEDNCYLICDSLCIRCDGLGGHCTYNFKNNKLNAIIYEGVALE